MEYLRHWFKGHKLTKCSKCDRKLWVKRKYSKDFKCSHHKFGLSKKM
jgi:hypothetical protein